MQHISLLANNSDSSTRGNLTFPIRRRNFFSGSITVDNTLAALDLAECQDKWRANEPILLQGMVKENLSDFTQDIIKARALYQAVLDNKDIDAILATEEYESHLMPDFELLAARIDAGDEQEICSIDFDTHIDGEIIEDIWMRVSWLSFDETDQSLRFRFSFGMEGFEDVSEDLQRQQLAALLEEKIFPESAILTENNTLNKKLASIIGCDNFQYLERIVYYNAPNGGAQFHHDAEKGHLGVVYAQVTGSTFWFALSKQTLVKEIKAFLSEEKNYQQFTSDLQEENLDVTVLEKFSDTSFIEQALNDLFHPELMLLLNQNKAFFAHLVQGGFGYYLQAGDIILLPQESMTACAWHSVFCVGEEAGEALSFAVKAFE